MTVQQTFPVCCSGDQVFWLTVGSMRHVYTVTVCFPISSLQILQTPGKFQLHCWWTDCLSWLRFCMYFFRPFHHIRLICRSVYIDITLKDILSGRNSTEIDFGPFKLKENIKLWNIKWRFYCTRTNVYLYVVNTRWYRKVPILLSLLPRWKTMRGEAKVILLEAYYISLPHYTLLWTCIVFTRGIFYFVFCFVCDGWQN
jgi:hypothetical protein